MRILEPTRARWDRRPLSFWLVVVVAVLLLFPFCPAFAGAESPFTE